jgi:aryl-alcohol dehydrogenase-like predicted oxidoreductase
MKTQRSGSHGPELSVIGFGAWEAGGTHWGPNASEDAVIDAMRAALDAGITWIDTAEVYGDGVSETLVGRAVAGRHDEVVIATKVAPGPEGSGFTPARVRKACEASLGRLGIDHIDLYQLHWPDEHGVPVEETWGAMADLVDAGLVGAIGVSNFDRELIERCEALRHVDSLQPEFSMLNLEHRELIRWCGERGIGVVSYGPLAFGVLTGAVTAETVFEEGDWRGGAWWEAEEFGPEELGRRLRVVEALRPIAARVGCSLAQLALAWNWHQPGVTSAIAGSRDATHVRANAQAGDILLDEATLQELDALLDRSSGR